MNFILCISLARENAPNLNKLVCMYNVIHNIIFYCYNLPTWYKMLETQWLILKEDVLEKIIPSKIL